MTTFYNQIAGRNLRRLEGLSDGVFAVALTLLVLDLHPPVAESIGFILAVQLVYAIGPRFRPFSWL